MQYRSSLFDKFGVYLVRILWIGVLGTLLVRTGSWLFIQPLAAASESPVGAFQLVDHFDTLALGVLHGQNGWQATNGIDVVTDPASGANRVVAVSVGDLQAYKTLPGAISNANVGTLHFRMRRSGHINGFVGLSDVTAPADWTSYETQIGTQIEHGATEFIVRDSTQFDVLSGSFSDQTWYCVWLVANNTNDTYQIYAQGGDFAAPTQLNAGGQTAFGFRNGGGDSLLTFLTRVDTKSQGTLYLDDIYVDPTSQNLTSPGGNCGTPPTDTTPPLVNWTMPVANGEVYEIFCGSTVALAATATDASGVNRVEFSRWDAVNNVVVPINTDSTAPYQATVDSCTLNMEWNEININAMDNAGNWANAYIWLYRVTLPPVAEFDAWPRSGEAPLPVAMHLVSRDNITSCTWQYGDGAIGNSCDPYHDHTYALPGSYTVELTVSGPGGSDTMIKNNYITVAAPTVQLGAATYSVNENSGAATIYVTLSTGSGQSVSVDYATSNGTATAGSDYTAANGSVTFGIGQTTASFTVPILDDSVDEPNETINLSLSNPTNATLGIPKSAILTIIDNDDPVPPTPTANFSASTMAGAKPLLVTFTDQSTGTITGWAWNFGDGSTSTQQSPTHIYNTAGEFTVSLTVTGPGGANTKTLTTPIRVSEPLPAAPTLSTIENGDQNGSYTVVWSSAANATGYELQEQQNSGSWTTLYTGSNTNHTLAGKGDGTWCYQVRATNGSGSSDWSSRQCTTVSTPINPPDTPVMGTITNQDGDSNYTVSWSSSVGATTYELQERVNSGSWTTIYSGANASYNLTEKTSGEWCYQVRATNAGGNSGWSTPHCVTIPSGTAQPSLVLPSQAPATPGSTVTLRLAFDANTNNISSLLFSVDYDQSKLTADSNGDGAVDAITFRSDLPASVIKSVSLDATDTDGELDFTIADFAASPQALPSGVIAEITLQVLPTTMPPAEALVQFAIASFGSAAGDITGTTTNGSVSIVARSPGIFLPLIRR